MNESIKLATVTGTGANGVLLRFDGEETARQKEYACINTPAIDDRVCLLEISGSWIVLGSIGGGGGGLPTGAIISFGGDAAPPGWLLCDGSEISRTEYANLFSAIGTAYGSGNGSTTFLIPNLRGRVPVGQDGSTEFSSLGQTGGEKTHSLTASENGEHNHTQAYHSHGFPSDRDVPTTMSSTRGDPVTTSASRMFSMSTVISETADTRATNYSSGDGDPHNNLQPYTVVNHIIKA